MLIDNKTRGLSAYAASLDINSFPGSRVWHIKYRLIGIGNRIALYD